MPGGITMARVNAFPSWMASFCNNLCSGPDYPWEEMCEMFASNIITLYLSGVPGYEAAVTIQTEWENRPRD